MNNFKLLICLLIGAHPLCAVRNSSRSDLIDLNNVLIALEEIKDGASKNSSIAKKGLEQFQLSYKNKDHKIVNPATKNFLEKKHKLLIKNKIHPSLRHIDIDHTVFDSIIAPLKTV